MVPRPERLGEWEIVRELGNGAFSTVYECKSANYHQTWAMKASPAIMQGSYASTPRRKESKQEVSNRLLFWEAQVYKLYAKDHACFPRLPSSNAFQENCNGWRYLIMERARGGSLKDMVASKAPRVLSQEAIFSMALRVLAGLENLNAKWFVYRDLKPENVCLTLDERGVILIDFGTAQKFVDAKREHFSSNAVFASVGTPQFMSIHVHQGKPPGRRDDLESLGYLMLWALNAGHLPAWERCSSEANMLQAKLEFHAQLETGIVGTAFADAAAKLKPYFKHVLGLGLEDAPDFRKLEAILMDLGGKPAGHIDWSREGKQPQLPPPPPKAVASAKDRLDPALEKRLIKAVRALERFEQTRESRDDGATMQKNALPTKQDASNGPLSLALLFVLALISAAMAVGIKQHLV